MKKSLLVLGSVAAFIGVGGMACGIFGSAGMLSVAVGALAIAGGVVLIARSFGCGVQERRELVK